MISAAIIAVLLPAGANQPAKPKPGEVWDAAMSDYELWHNVPFLQGHGPAYSPSGSDPPPRTGST